VVTQATSVPDQVFFFFFFFFGWGKRREMRHARCEGLQYGLPVGLFARWTVCRLTYPLKPPPAGGPSYIPLREIHGWIWVGVEVNETFVPIGGTLTFGYQGFGCQFRVLALRCHSKFIEGSVVGPGMEAVLINCPFTHRAWVQRWIFNFLFVVRCDPCFCFHLISKRFSCACTARQSFCWGLTCR